MLDEIQYKDVPTWVWDRVYEKWEDALRAGWSYSLWNPCPLCRHVYHYSLWRMLARALGLITAEDMCRTCPLYDPGWCKSSPSRSRLHINHPAPVETTEILCRDEAWKFRVTTFLETIETLTSGGKQ